MKKTLITFLILVLLGGLASPVFGEVMRKTTLTEEKELSASVDDTGWLQSYVANADRISYFITLDSSSTTQSTTANVTIQASADGTNWVDISWFDLVGGSTLQINETLCSEGDETYMMWLNRDLAVPHLRIKIFNDEGKEWDTQTLDVTVTIIEDK